MDSTAVVGATIIREVVPIRVLIISAVINFPFNMAYMDTPLSRRDIIIVMFPPV